MSRESKCIIWGTPAKLEDPTGDYSDYDSPRAGGRYKVSGSATAELSALANNRKVLLTDWLIAQRQLSVDSPVITTETLKAIETARPLTVQQRMNNLLSYLTGNNQQIGKVISFCSNELSKQYELFAWTSSLKTSELITLAEYCNESGYIEYKETDEVGIVINSQYSTIRGDFHELMLKAKGHALLESQKATNQSSTNCFVAMWFDDQMNDAYENGIAPAVQQCGYSPIRVDEQEHIGKIDDRIIAEIRQAKFIIADFTSEKNRPRGGVYYEAGFAQGLNIPVIWTCRKDMIGNVHFDTRQFNHITWEEPEELKDKLINRIAAVIGKGPTPSS